MYRMEVRVTDKNVALISQQVAFKTMGLDEYI
jgi:hypothetical protein